MSKSKFGSIEEIKNSRTLSFEWFSFFLLELKLPLERFSYRDLELFDFKAGDKVFEVTIYGANFINNRVINVFNIFLV